MEKMNKEGHPSSRKEDKKKEQPQIVASLGPSFEKDCKEGIGRGKKVTRHGSTKDKKA